MALRLVDVLTQLFPELGEQQTVAQVETLMENLFSTGVLTTGYELDHLTEVQTQVEYESKEEKMHFEDFDYTREPSDG